MRYKSLGGLTVSDRMEVLDADGNPIPGLYAAGCTAGTEDIVPAAGSGLLLGLPSPKTSRKHVPPRRSEAPSLRAAGGCPFPPSASPPKRLSQAATFHKSTDSCISKGALRAFSHAAFISSQI